VLENLHFKYLLSQTATPSTQTIISSEIYRGADKFSARPGNKQATATTL